MVGLLIIAHAPLASALRAVAQHTFPECASRLVALDVTPDMSPEDIACLASDLLEQVRDPDALVFSDVFGATPCNVAHRLAGLVTGGEVRVVAGVNVPMLWRSLCYAGDTVDVLAARAVASGNQGVLQLISAKPQNQPTNLVPHDQEIGHHQQ